MGQEYTELPDRLGAVLTKELRQSLRRASFIYPFLLIHLFATIAVFFDFQLGLNHSISIVPGLFIWIPHQVGAFWWVAMTVCAFILPLGGFFAMSQELEEGNYEILLLTNLSRWEVVQGKFLTLWTLSFLTFISLLPYIIIRYFIGGIEWLHEISHAGTVLLSTALACSATISASGFKTLAGKAGVFALFLAVIFLGGGGALIPGTLWMNQATELRWIIFGVIFHHFVAIGITACLIILGMFLARSRLRVALMNYELNPSSALLVMLGCTAGITFISCGMGGLLAIPVVTFIAYHSDKKPLAPKHVTPPPLNIPGTENPA